LFTLDGQALLCSEFQMLQFARKSDILLSCLHAKSTKYFLNSERTICSSVKEYWSIIYSTVLLCEKWLHEDWASSDMCILWGSCRCLGNVKI